MSNLPRPLTRRFRWLAAFLLACASIVLAAPGRALAQDNSVPLVVFGDSFSDSGNGFAFVHTNATPPDFGLNELLVPQAPYAVGGHHLTNGDTWIEQLAARFEIGRYAQPAFASANPNAMNFAIATARARRDGTNPSLALEIATFLQKTGGVAPPGALYVIQIGGNDLRDALAAAFGQPPDPIGAALILQSALQGIADGIATLYAAGARHFLVWNVPSQALTPTVRILDLSIPGFQSAAAFATGLFNYTLSHDSDSLPDVVDGLRTLPGIDIRLFNADALLAAIYLSPSAFGFTNVIDACVTPGTAPFRCQTPDRYLFWDGIHPTKAAHGVIARAVAHMFGYW